MYVESRYHLYIKRTIVINKLYTRRNYDIKLFIGI